MKTRNKECFLLLFIVLFLFQPCIGLAQKNSTRNIIQRAIKDEMERNISRLELEDMERPFFISYNIYDVKTFEVNSSLGAIINSNEIHNRNYNVRVIVGDYSLNDENFRDSGYSYRSSMLQGSSRLPLEDDYDGIRRALWIATDDIYKRAVETYEHKKAALKQQTRTDEETQLDDFSRIQVVTYTEPPRTFDIDSKKWEKTAKEISGIFRKYSNIYSSKVRIFLYQGDMFLTTSEGTEVNMPLTLAVIQINANTQAVDGEPLRNYVMYYASAPEDLPPKKVIKQSVKTMAEELLILREAPVFDESYFGPVMLEGQAVAEFFQMRLFSGRNGLLAYRRPVVSNPGGRYGSSSGIATLDDRMNRRILSRELTIKALPGLERFQGKNLIGSYRIDLEGVKPPEEIILVENGILKTLLTNRIPNPKVRESNGHQRPVIRSAYSSSIRLGPSVITVSTSKGKSYPELKKELLQRAREEGMEYGIIIRKLNPAMVYCVYVEDGREEPVRSVKLGAFSLSTLRHIASVSEKQFVYNTLASGIPASFIVPQTLILEELEVKNEKRDYTPKLPVVSSPLSQK